MHMQRLAPKYEGNEECGCQREGDCTGVTLESGEHLPRAPFCGVGFLEPSVGAGRLPLQLRRGTVILRRSS